MNNRTIYIIRGLPGSGKTTYAKKLLDAERANNSNTAMFAADDYFYRNGEYVFEPEKLKKAHELCQSNTRSAMAFGASIIAVHNTFTTQWEVDPYLKLASEYRYRVIVINMFDGELTDEELARRNTHGVPVSSIRRMRDRWEEVSDAVY